MTDQETQSELIERLAMAIAKHIPRQIPLINRLWSIEQVAHYLGLSATYVHNHFPSAPGFPTPIRVCMKKGVKGHPRFKAVEVIRWAEAHRDSPAFRQQPDAAPRA